MRLADFGLADAVEIIPGLQVGSAPGRRAVRSLLRDGVTLVVDLRAEGANAPPWPGSITVIERPLIEYAAPDPRVLGGLADEVARLMGRGEVVYMHCRAGIQRAPMVACAVLIQCGWSLADAYRLVGTRRGVTSISEAQMDALRVVELEIASRGLAVRA